MIIGTGQQKYGLIQEDFEFDLPGSGYLVLSGRNNKGKSSVIQLLFSKLVKDVSEVGAKEVCLLLPERIFVHSSMETGGTDLAAFNINLAKKMVGHPLEYGSLQYNSNELLRLLVSNTEFRALLDQADGSLESFGFPKMDLAPGGRTLSLDGVSVTVQGSGLRSILPVMAALKDQSIRYIFIDEPEGSLEPELQKALREMFYEASVEKTIVVTTHSHLFLNRKDKTSNLIVDVVDDHVRIKQVATKFDLQDLTFRLLGASPEDIFFPRNYLIVEGASDQELVNKVLELNGLSLEDYVVVAARGVIQVDDFRRAFEATISSAIVGSIYKESVVVLIDKPGNEKDEEYVESELRKHLGERIHELDVTSMEEYLPDDLYKRAGLDKKEVLNKVSQVTRYDEKSVIKKEVSRAIASILVKDDLDRIAEFNEFVKRAKRRGL